MGDSGVGERTVGLQKQIGRRIGVVAPAHDILMLACFVLQRGTPPMKKSAARP